MAQKTSIELLKEIVGAYESLVNVEIAGSKPDLYEAARGGLSDRIDEARAMLKSMATAKETPFVSNKASLASRYRRGHNLPRLATQNQLKAA